MERGRGPCDHSSREVPARLWRWSLLALSTYLPRCGFEISGGSKPATGQPPRLPEVSVVHGEPTLEQSLRIPAHSRRVHAVSRRDITRVHDRGAGGEAKKEIDIGQQKRGVDTANGLHLLAPDDDAVRRDCVLGQQPRELDPPARRSL
jgi:hypothetical protein